jgi:hypothetical protein
MSEESLGMRIYETHILAIRENYRKKRFKRDKFPKGPAWMAHSPLNQLYREGKQLFREGKIVYAYLVQANEILFQKTPELDCPAAIVFSLDSYFDAYPHELGNYARALMQYKNTEEAPDDLKALVSAITDEHEMLFHVELPLSLTGGFTVFYTSIMVFRDHLPEKTLTSVLFPVITSPYTLQTSTILPKEYWTKELTEAFISK